jgi:hydrogenase maturation protease
VKTLVVGVGNPTRSDDGVGPDIAGRIDALGLAGVEVRRVQQLQVELAEDFADFERVVVIDASAGGPPHAFRTVRPAATDRSGGSHHCSSSLLLALAGRLHGRVPELRLCTVRGEEFGFGAGLSPRVRERAEAAFARVRACLQGV